MMQRWADYLDKVKGEPALNLPSVEHALKCATGPRQEVTDCLTNSLPCETRRSTPCALARRLRWIIATYAPKPQRGLKAVGQG